MSKLQRIFEPIRIGRVTIPNRVVRTAHGTWIARGYINEELIACKCPAILTLREQRCTACIHDCDL
jgi:hypothetical protein